MVPGSNYGARWLLTMFLAAAVSWAGADGYILPGATLSDQGDAVTLRYRNLEATYVRGLGWLNGWQVEAPVLLGSSVVASDDLLEAMGVTAPRLWAVRVGGERAVRLVLDIPELAAFDLANLEQVGELGDGETLLLTLPELLLPTEIPDPGLGVEVALETKPGRSEVTITTPAAHYQVDVLSDPTRVVIDLTPGRPKALADLTSEVAPGVIYRRFSAANGIGISVVHIVEITTGSGELRVVGGDRVPRTLSELSSGALVAINAGYFDTETFAAIGLLQIDHGLLSLPSRRRASVAFGSDGSSAIYWVKAGVEVVVDGRPTLLDSEGRAVTVHRTPGALVGSARTGVIVAAGGVVRANTVGPVLVPLGGLALVYDPGLRPLALVEGGSDIDINVVFEPSAIAAARYAVEAGPLLISDGQPAFEPEREGFSRGTRILDAFTQQAAIGVHQDGSVVLLVAETMTAEQLIPLFQKLGVRDAMRLDSGSSAGLFVAGEVVNRRFEREIVSAIVLVAPPP